MQTYTADKGQFPSDATQFHNFVKHRGGILSFGQARQAIKAASSGPEAADKAAARRQGPQPCQPQQHDDGDWMNSKKWVLKIQAIGGKEFPVEVRPSCTVDALRTSVCGLLALDEDTTVKLTKGETLLDVGAWPLHKFGVSSDSEIMAVTVPAFLHIKKHVYRTDGDLISTEEVKLQPDVALKFQGNFLRNASGMPAMHLQQMCRVNLQGQSAPKRWDALEMDEKIEEVLSVEDKRSATEIFEGSSEVAVMINIMPPPD